MIYETPTTQDIAYALSMLMHDARRQVEEEKNRITGLLTAHGGLRSNRVIIMAADAVDKIHIAQIGEAKKILTDFVQRMGRPAREITALARSHLENLSNTLLTEIPSNGFPDDQKRTVGQYQAMFSQRLEGALREIEIGYARGPGFAPGTEMTEEEWISARDAIALFGKDQYLGSRTICSRAHSGLIKARAHRFVRHGKSTDNVDVPVEFWWAKGAEALNQNWRSGDFDTWIDHKIHLEAFGVTFRRSDVEQAHPAPPGDNAQARLPIPAGRKVFIGHGRSLLWLELKIFLEKLNLVTDEFNSVSAAGIPTATRLKEMVDSASFAFLVMTAEDEQPNGKFNARQNVIHETGLFQGRLGFERAIVLLEEGCEEFSNIHGMGHIPFPPGKIKASFEEIRDVLKREKLIV